MVSCQLVDTKEEFELDCVNQLKNEGRYENWNKKCAYSLNEDNICPFTA